MEALAAVGNILLVVTTIAFLCVLGWMASAVIKYISTKHKYLEGEIERVKLLNEERHHTVDPSKELLTLIGDLVAKVAVIKFQTFKDTHRIDEHIAEGKELNLQSSTAKSLIEEIAQTSRGALQMDNIPFDDMYFTKDFYEKYIIESSVMLVKKMLNESIDQVYEG